MKITAHKGLVKLLKADKHTMGKERRNPTMSSRVTSSPTGRDICKNNPQSSVKI
jgi:hypothetical protein